MQFAAGHEDVQGGFFVVGGFGLHNFKDKLCLDDIFVTLFKFGYLLLDECVQLFGCVEMD